MASLKQRFYAEKREAVGMKGSCKVWASCVSNARNASVYQEDYGPSSVIAICSSCKHIQPSFISNWPSPYQHWVPT
eukprot:CAMPEP_0174357962 /NCGR_PEP_ID=MMETSP0811_2-20130205/38964_1 /TAXON_ID=73025 ORGANISM="Eutreptiella gymnastica-like, Strain CCMP1594" /NCGR_SAMPLE_ID=MMETSP0811_2 /ASSEMBLY_ACC=CAM_ASM_000667 /LENGTH=75 /DNA_ID=CAMNT_0015491251 /DNA_START=189 /DNA_END=416 /DNA_ORIENTATION=+